MPGCILCRLRQNSDFTYAPDLAVPKVRQLEAFDTLKLFLEVLKRGIGI